jgi:RNA polymerase sigma factor for flagellar operon FliA
MAHEARRYVIAGSELSREEIVIKYLHLVKYAAGRISINLPPNVEIDDLINDGILGLIDAIEKYNNARGVKFETYAVMRISGAILDALRALDWVPRAVRQRARELERIYQEVESEYGRAATAEDIADRMGMTVKELAILLRTARGTSVLSLEEYLPNERGHEISFRDTLQDDGDEVSSAVEAREIKAALGSRGRWAPAPRACGDLALLLRRPDDQGDQGRARRLRVTRFPDPRSSGDSSVSRLPLNIMKSTLCAIKRSHPYAGDARHDLSGRPGRKWGCPRAGCAWARHSRRATPPAQASAEFAGRDRWP